MGATLRGTEIRGETGQFRTIPIWPDDLTTAQSALGSAGTAGRNEEVFHFGLHAKGLLDALLARRWRNAGALLRRVTFLPRLPLVGPRTRRVFAWPWRAWRGRLSYPY